MLINNWGSYAPSPLFSGADVAECESDALPAVVELVPPVETVIPTKPVDSSAWTW